MKKPRNRAAQDATLINIRKLKAALTDLKKSNRALDMRVGLLTWRIKKLEQAR